MRSPHPNQTSQQQGHGTTGSKDHSRQAAEKWRCDDIHKEQEVGGKAHGVVFVKLNPAVFSDGDMELRGRCRERRIEIHSRVLSFFRSI